jgi:hypothetical protein
MRCSKSLKKARERQLKTRHDIPTGQFITH